MKSCYHDRTLVASLLLALMPGATALSDLVVPVSSTPARVLSYSLRSVADVPDSAEATYIAEGIGAREIIRGPGITATLLTEGFSANHWTNPEEGVTPSREMAIARGDYYQFGFSVKEDHEASLATLDVKLRRSARNAPMFLEWQYSLDGFATPGIPVVAEWLNFESGAEPSPQFGYFARAAGTSPDSYETFQYMIDWRTDSTVSELDGQQEGNWMPTLDLSGVEALQGMAEGTEFSLRLYAWGNDLTVNSNTFAFGREDGPILMGSVRALPTLQRGVVYAPGGAPSNTRGSLSPPASMGPLLAAPGLYASQVTRGPGLAPAYLSQGFSSNNWSNPNDHNPSVAPSRQNAISRGDFYELSIAVEPSHRAGFTSLDTKLRRSSGAAPGNVEWQYSLDGFATLGTTLHGFTYLGQASGEAPDSYEEFAYMTSRIEGQDSGNPMPTIDLSGVAALQGLRGGTEVTFRLYAWGSGSTSNSNTFAFGRSGSGRPEGPIPVLSFGIDVIATPEDLPSIHGPPGPLPDSPSVTEPAMLDLTVIDPEDGEIEIIFLGRPKPVLPSHDDFTIALLPDTQIYTGELNGGKPEMFFAQTDWIVARHMDINIPFVLHMGDIVQRGDIKGGLANAQEWAHAADAMYRLDDPATTGVREGIPYAMNVGNHDQEPIWDPEGTTLFYNQYFGVDRFEGKRHYGGHYGENNDNFYMLFETGPFRSDRFGPIDRNTGSVGFIVISLEYREFADPAILEWADALLKAHPDRRGIVVTHHLMSPGNPGAWSPYGEAIYETLKDNANLDFMFGGHVTGEGTRVDTYEGNTVISMMQDYQGMADGGSGFLRLLTFRPDQNEVLTNTYSPWLDAHLPNWGNPRTLPYDFGREPAPFGEIARLTVSSGSRVEFPWDGLEADADYEWYAVLNDGATSTETDRFEFHTSPSTYTSWRRQFFEEDDPSGDRSSDPDDDGYSNYFEYVFDGDPSRSGILRQPQPSLVVGPGQMVVEYRRLRNTGLSWRAEVSENLLQWTSWEEHPLIMEEELADNGDGSETVRLIITNPGKALFWRLVVE